MRLVDAGRCNFIPLRLEMSLHEVLSHSGFFCGQVANPEETDFFIKLLLADIRAQRDAPYIE